MRPNEGPNHVICILVIGVYYSQDAFELYQYFLELLSKLPPTITSDWSQENDKVMTEANRPNLDPRTCFGFLIEDRIQCGSSGKVKYTRRPDNALSLAIPLEASTNKGEERSLKLPHGVEYDCWVLDFSSH